MARAHTTRVTLETADYFVAHLNTGGVRVGFLGGACLDIPAAHPLYAEALALTAETVEEFHDAHVMSRV